MTQMNSSSSGRRRGATPGSTLFRHLMQDTPLAEAWKALTQPQRDLWERHAQMVDDALARAAEGAMREIGVLFQVTERDAAFGRALYAAVHPEGGWADLTSGERAQWSAAAERFLVLLRLGERPVAEDGAA